MRVPMAQLSFIISEEALGDPVGDAGTMRGQWQHLLKLSASRNVEVQVMPARRGFHPGKNGPFVVVESEMPQRSAPSRCAMASCGRRP